MAKRRPDLLVFLFLFSSLLFPFRPVSLRALPVVPDLDLTPEGLNHLYDRAGTRGPSPLQPLPGRFAPLKSALPGPQARQVPFHEITLPRTVFPPDAVGPSAAPHLVRAIDHTRKSLKIALYSFSLQEVLEAIERAAARGVRVQVLLDEKHVYPQTARGPPAAGGPQAQRTPQIQALLDNPKIEVRTLRGLGNYGHMHNKVALFDDVLVKYGSYNWSRTAENLNYENANFSAEQDRLTAYLAYWRWMWKNGSPEDRPGSTPIQGKPPRDAAYGVQFHGHAFPKTVFSPKGGIAWQIIRAIRYTQGSVDLAMNNFYHQELASELASAKARGVRIRLILDETQSRKMPLMKFFKEKGFDVRVLPGRTGGPYDDKAALALKFSPEAELEAEGLGSMMHHKYAVFDGALLETGSFNWSFNGELNSFENANFSDDSADIAEYQEDFNRLYAKAKPPVE